MMRLDEMNLNDLIQDLPNWQLSRRLLVISVCWVVFGVGFFFLFWQQSLESNARMDADIRSALARLNTQSHMLVERPAIEAQLTVLEAQLPVLKMALPSERELASLLERINAMILDHGLRLSRFKPETPENQEVMRVVPVLLSVRGEGATVAQLPNYIASLTRQVRLKNFEMQVMPDNAGWQLNGQLNAFAQLPANTTQAQELAIR
jgi:type IV pilus assembly protein PilO